MVDILIMVTCFVKNVNNIFNVKWADLNKLVQEGQLYWAFPFSKSSLDCQWQTFPHSIICKLGKTACRRGDLLGRISRKKSFITIASRSADSRKFAGSVASAARSTAEERTTATTNTADTPSACLNRWQQSAVSRLCFLRRSGLRKKTRAILDKFFKACVIFSSYARCFLPGYSVNCDLYYIVSGILWYLP